jgi:hypothetical protein
MSFFPTYYALRGPLKEDRRTDPLEAAAKSVVGGDAAASATYARRESWKGTTWALAVGGVACLRPTRASAPILGLYESSFAVVVRYWGNKQCGRQRGEIRYERRIRGQCGIDAHANDQYRNGQRACGGYHGLCKCGVIAHSDLSFSERC